MPHKEVVDYHGQSGANEQCVNYRAEPEPHVASTVIDGRRPREGVVVVLHKLVGLVVDTVGLVLNDNVHESPSSGVVGLVAAERKTSRNRFRPAAVGGAGARPLEGKARNPSGLMFGYAASARCG
jgi:hypothetical protein